MRNTYRLKDQWTLSCRLKGYSNSSKLAKILCDVSNQKDITDYDYMVLLDDVLPKLLTPKEIATKAQQIFEETQFTRDEEPEKTNS